MGIEGREESGYDYMLHALFLPLFLIEYNKHNLKLLYNLNIYIICRYLYEQFSYGISNDD